HSYGRWGSRRAVRRARGPACAVRRYADLGRPADGHRGAPLRRARRGAHDQPHVPRPPRQRRSRTHGRDLREGAARVRRGRPPVGARVPISPVAAGAPGGPAAAILAARPRAAARAAAGAALALAAVADARPLVPEPASGSRAEGRYHLQWAVVPVRGGARIVITATYDDGRVTRSVPLVVFHDPPPPRIGGGPCRGSRSSSCSSPSP